MRQGAVMPAKRRLPGWHHVLTRAGVVLAAAAAIVGVVCLSSSLAHPVVTRTVVPALFVTTGRPAPAPANSGSHEHLVVLGDSVAAGAGCSCPTYADLLATRLATNSGQPATLTNAGQDGMTTADLLSQLDDLALTRALHSATVVTITIGANDFDDSLAGRDDCAVGSALFCYRAELSALSGLLHQVLSRIHQLTPTSATVIATGYWNVFLDGDIGRLQGRNYVATSDALTRAVNAIIALQSALTADRYADLYTPFQSQTPSRLTALLATDGDHPSAQGHQLIADVVADQLRSRATGRAPRGNWTSDSADVLWSDNNGLPLWRPS